MSVYSVNVYPSCTTIKTGNWYYNAYATVSASSNCNTDVEWYSDSPSVATVNASSGYIYAKAPGTAKIYAQSIVDSSKKDYITVNVTSDKIYVSSVTLNRSSISLEKGDTFDLCAAVFPTNATNKTINWRTTNSCVATVSGGVVTAKASGTAYIYAEAQDGSGEYARCYVNVTEDILVTSVTVSPSCKTMNIGSSAYLYETVYPTNATNKCVAWSSSDSSVVSVNSISGLVYAKKAGMATITATAQDGSKQQGYCIIKVNAPIPVTGVEVCPTNLTMNVGETECLSASITPSNATNQTVTWCSSNENVATVGLYTGKITAKMAGTTTITATTADGGFKVSCILVVISRYEYELINSCGFSKNVAQLILSIYQRVNNIYSTQTNIERAWRCARLLSEFYYDYLSYGIINKWDDVAGSVTTKENRKTYFIDTLGFTESEYDTLNCGLLRNKEDADNCHNIIDFTHMQFALAARLAYFLNKSGDISNIFSGLYTGNYGIYTDEEISYLGGWLGDAVLTKIYGQGTTAMKNDDYMADLDAENIYRLIIQGKSALVAINEYYSNMTASNTRADMFLQNISYNTVKEKVFYELIDAELYVLMSNASNQGNIVLVNHYFNLINNEEYHFDTIKANYYDTYNFLKSLNDRLLTMEQYL